MSGMRRGFPSVDPVNRRADGVDGPKHHMSRILALALVLLAALAVPAGAAWDVTKPADTDLISAYPAAQRTDKSSLLTCLGLEHKFIASDTQGYHLLGTARIHVSLDAVKGTPGLSATPTVDSLGRVHFSTDNNALYYGTAGNAWSRMYPAPNAAQYTLAWEADPATTNSTEWADLFTQALTTTASTGGHLLIMATVTARNDTAGAFIFFGLEVDGVALTTAGYGLGMIAVEDASAKAAGTCSIIRRTITLLTAGAHTVKLRWKVNGGTATMQTGVSNSLIVMEM